MDTKNKQEKEMKDLKTAEEDLQIYADILRAMPSGLFIYQYHPPDTLILLDGNPSTKRLTGIDVTEYRGKEFNEIWPKALESGVTETFLNVMKTGVAFETEELRYKDENLEGAFSVRVFRIPGQRMVVTFENITQRKRTEEALRESEERFRILSEGTSEGIVIHQNGNILQANQQFYDMFGYAPEELEGKDVTPLCISPQSIPIVRDHIQSGSIGPYEVMACKKGGTEFPIEVRAQIMERDGRPVRMVAIRNLEKYKQVEEALRQARDELEERVEKRTAKLKQEIVVRKQAEKKLEKHQKKLRSLASQLSLAEEKERQRMAIEVHDRIGQNLAFAKLKLDQLRMSASPDYAGPVGEIIALINDTIKDTRSLVSELGSPVLYELGLVPGIEWFLKRMGSQHDIHIDFKKDDSPKSLSENVSIFVFQAIREFLANVVKHAQASHCSVSLTASRDTLRLDIVDDGIGFDTAEMEPVSGGGRGFGFFSIRERAEPLGGKLTVDSQPGKGTCVQLTVPLEKTRESSS